MSGRRENGTESKPSRSRFERAYSMLRFKQRPTIKHSHPERQKESSDAGMPMSATQNAAKRFRHGACENCEAIGHTKSDCLEQPREKKPKHENSVKKEDMDSCPRVTVRNLHSNGPYYDSKSRSMHEEHKIETV
ncbi:hypothetical protein M3Y94_00935600 [Aphelenchoides besseyi]|nr:hypothetical protein M3Y94_00935600 [Aphelenchoides besseyi]